MGKRKFEDAFVDGLGAVEVDFDPAPVEAEECECIVLPDRWTAAQGATEPTSVPTEVVEGETVDPNASTTEMFWHLLAMAGYECW